MRRSAEPRKRPANPDNILLRTSPSNFGRGAPAIQPRRLTSSETPRAESACKAGMTLASRATRSLSESTNTIVKWRGARGAAQGTSRVPDGRPDSARDSSAKTSAASSCAQNSTSPYFANRRAPEVSTCPPSQAACRAAIVVGSRFSSPRASGDAPVSRRKPGTVRVAAAIQRRNNARHPSSKLALQNGTETDCFARRKARPAELIPASSANGASARVRG
jgi:hypothetical protein